MKIILSPSKTKEIKGLPTVGLFCQKKTAMLAAHLSHMSAADLGKALKLRDDKAKESLAFYENYTEAPVGEAVQSYTGLAFKNLNWDGLSEKGKQFGYAHLVILSAFYGVVEPGAPLTDYRLDLADRIFKKEKTDLYAFWREDVKRYFANEEEIINLASKEYSKIVDHPRVVTVEFWEEKEGILKQLSTTSKQMRGRLAHHILEEGIRNADALPDVFEGFTKKAEDNFIKYCK